MKKMKKLFLLVILIMSFTTLASCNKEGGGEGEDKPKTVNLTYAEWGDAELAQSMIDAFMVAHPNIKVQLDTTITGTGTAFTNNLVAAAQAGILPDVFATDNVPTVIDANLVYDIADLWNADEETDLVYDNVASTAVYGGKRLAAPSYQFIRGIFVNKTLLRNLGITIPEYNWTFEEFYDICQQVKTAGSYGGYNVYAINGYYGVLSFEAVMPCQDSNTLTYDCWNGRSFDYENDLWIKYRKYTEAFTSQGLLEKLTADEKKEIYGDESAEPFAKGHCAFGEEYSWNTITRLDQYEAAGLDVEFYPYPAGTTQKEPVVLDYMCVSSLTSYPKEAYELLKWMTFGRDGWAKRLEIMKAKNIGIDRFPVADYPEIWTDLNTYMGQLKDGGKKYGAYNYAIEIIGNAVPDCNKWLPGYGDFWAWVEEVREEQDWYNKQTDQLAREWSTELNRFVDEAYTRLGLVR